jgi:hypothetical protein
MNNSTPTTQLEIGQVIFCISGDTGALYPVQVTEEVVHKSITGTKKSYTVRLDLFDDQGVVETKITSLESLNDLWFPTLAVAKDHMLKQAAAFVDEMADKAEKLSMMSFGEEMRQLATSDTTEQSGAMPSIRKKPTVTMPDGTKIELDVHEN